MNLPYITKNEAKVLLGLAARKDKAPADFLTELSEEQLPLLSIITKVLELTAREMHPTDLRTRRKTYENLLAGTITGLQIADNWLANKIVISVPPSSTPRRRTI